MGATPSQLLRFHLANGSVLLLVAVPIGLILALTSARFVEALLYGVTAFDAISLTAAAVLTTMTGVIATYIPAHSAATADPAQALRVE
jgi:ABC-type antimicrobial peptide transport system permease subunit